LLAELGKAIRDREPQFKPGAYGKENLISLLRLVPDLGTVRKAMTSSAEVFVFNEGGATSSDLPASAPRIRSDIWKAIIEFRQPADPWYLDLETFALRNRAGDPDGLLVSEPERFIALPTAGADFQKDLARRFIAAHRPDLAQRLDTELVTQQWYQALLDTFRSVGLDDAWHAFRAKALATHVATWANQHGIPIEKIAHPRLGNRPERTRSEGNPDPIDDMRALVHDAIDMMSAQEIGSLPIPPVYLVTAAMRRLGRGSR
jgi:hypothetical protein